MGALLVAEVSGIQDWIVGRSTELRVIRGGSELLRQVFDEAADELDGWLGSPDEPTDDEHPPAGGWHLLVRSSGRLTAGFASREVADEAGVVVRRRLARELEGLTLRVVVVDWPERPGGFRAALSAAHVTRASARPLVHRVPIHTLGAQTCDATGHATAVGRPTSLEGWRLSASAAVRQRLAPEVEGAEVERDMSAIGAASRSARFGGYVGVVSADGNAVGALFTGLETPRQLRDTSTMVHDSVQQAIAAAHDAARRRDRTQGATDDEPLPINPIMQAGDDLRFVLPAHAALEFAASLTTHGQLNSCAGVVLCHATLPFHLAHDAAEQVLGRAKAAARTRDHDDPPPMVAYAVESGATPATPVDDGAILGPWAPEQLDALIDTAASLALSTSSLRQMLPATTEPTRVMDREWALFLARTPGARDQLGPLWERLGLGSLDEGPTMAVHNGGSRTPLADLLVLAGLLQPPMPTAVA